MYRKKCPNHSKELAYGQVRSGGERVNGGGGGRGGGGAAAGNCPSKQNGFHWYCFIHVRAALILFVKYGCAIFGVLRYFL